MKPHKILISIIFIITQQVSFAQENTVFNRYYPPFTLQGKVDTLTLYVTAPLTLQGSQSGQTYNLLTSCQKAANKWNTILTFLQIPRVIRIQSLPLLHTQTSPQDTIFGPLSNLNLIGFVNNVNLLPLNSVTRWGITVLLKATPFTINTQTFYEKTVQHIGINQESVEKESIQTGSFDYIPRFAPPGQPRLPSQMNIDLIICHEMGHLLGMSHNVPSESIMRSGSKWEFADFLNYDGTTDIPLQDIDKKILKSIYAQFFISDRHKNDTCIPWSNLPSAQDTIQIQR